MECGVDTLLRPYLVIYSTPKRVSIWGELTVPLERNFVEAYLRKKARYAALKTDLRLQKWTVIDHTREIGTLGFISKHTYFFLRSLGFSNSQRKHLCKQMSKVALRSSYYIWMARHRHTFAPPCLVARPKPPEIKI